MTSAPQIQKPVAGFAVLPHENQSEYDDLILGLYEEFNPQGVHETFLVDHMAQARWRMDRVDRLEDKAFALMMGETDDSPDGRIVAFMAKNGRDPLPALQRCRAAAERSYSKAHRDLLYGRKNDQKFQEKAMNKYIKEQVLGPLPTKESVASQTGFASQKTESALRL